MKMKTKMTKKRKEEEKEKEEKKKLSQKTWKGTQMVFHYPIHRNFRASQQDWLLKLGFTETKLHIMNDLWLKIRKTYH